MRKWTERVEPSAYSIVPMAAEHADSAATLVINALQLTPKDVEDFGGESPQGCFARYLQKDRNDRRAENAEWSLVTRNDPQSLQYYVALDTQQKVIGVSGIYQALPGYSQKIGADHVCSELENNKTFWLGWFGVGEGSRDQGVGTALLRSSVEQAVQRAHGEVANYRYAIYADKGAIDYYQKLGFQKIASVHEVDAVLSAPLEALAVRLGVPLGEQTRVAINRPTQPIQR